jgi:hypothetical protein
VTPCGSCKADDSEERVASVIRVAKVKLSEREAEHSPSVISERKMELYLHSAILHAVMLTSLGLGANGF